MWVVAGVLLGLVLFAALTGFHVGPHAHVAAGVLGVLAADLVVSAGVALLAYKGLTSRESDSAARRLAALEGAQGTAVGELDPEGIVRVLGESWSAVSVNGTVRPGAPVQVLRVHGVRLEVWGEENVPEVPAKGLGGEPADLPWTTGEHPTSKGPAAVESERRDP
jgi:membrane-bound ClpP family serine protease